MNDVRRRIVRLSIFLLPAFLLLAGFYVARGDLRDKASTLRNPGVTRYGNEFAMRGAERLESVAAFARDAIASLKRNRFYIFKAPESGFRIEVRNEPGPSECDPGSHRIVIRGIPDDAGVEKVLPDLSRLLARAMLREGAPDADFSPWFEEGISRFYEGTQMPLGSRKDDLITEAARNPPKTLAEALSVRHGPYFAAISHSIVAFLHEAFLVDTISKYAEIERAPGSIPNGEFERIFGQEVEKAWRDFLERRQKGS